MNRFQPGQSGNPVGRPRGSVNKLLQAMREAGEVVLPMVLQRAMDGDVDAQRLIIERSVPRMKPIAPAEPFILPDGSVSQQVQALLQQVADGDISVDAATQAMGLVAANAKAKEFEAQEAKKTVYRNMASMPAAPVGGTYISAVQAKLGHSS